MLVLLELQTLKGHTACVNALCVYPSEENKSLLFSGAYDTTIKLWDLRTRATISQFKGHNMQINTLAVSPNSKLLASGSNDGQVKVWDIGQAKLIASFAQHDSQITCLSFNPVEKALASGGADRCVRYWDLDRLGLLSTSRTDTTPIQSILFEQGGKILFSAVHESLKVWDVEHDTQLLDNVESNWRGVQDMIIIPDRDQLLGLASNPQGFSLHGVSLKTICLDSAKAAEVRSSGGAVKGNERRRTPDRRQEIQTAQVKQLESETKVKSKPSLQMQAQNILNQDYNYDRQLSNEQFKEPPQSFLPPLQSPQLSQQNYGYVQQFQQQQQQQLQQQQQQQLLYQYQLQQQFQQQYQSNNTPQHYNDLRQIPQVPQIIAQNNTIDDDENQTESQDMITSGDITLSQFMIGDTNKEKFKQVDLINEIVKDHNKVNQILTQRMNYMKPILHWWSNNNIKSSLNAISQLTEPSILHDALALCSQQPKFSQIGIDYVPILLEKARVLIDSRYTSYIRAGLDFSYKALNQFREEILNIKLFNQMSKADLAREERVLKYDKVIEQFKIIVQMPKMQKLIDRNKDDLSELAKKLQIEVIGFLKKVNQNQMQN